LKRLLVWYNLGLMSSVSEPFRKPLAKRNWLRNLCALALGLSVFPLAELCLVLFQVNPELGRNMGNFGIESKVPLFESDKAGGAAYWYPSKKWFGKMRYYESDIRRSFEMPKPENVFRILVLGESSAAGHPFGPRVAFSRWLEVMLKASVPGRNFEVLNLGINGIGSYELKVLMPQALLAQPDVAIIYAGHNDCMIEKTYSGSLRLDGLASRASHELLRFRLYRLVFGFFHNDHSARRKAVFQHYAGLRRKGQPPERDKYFYAPKSRLKAAGNFRRNLEEIIAMTQQSGTPLVLCTVEYNLLDWAPEGSVPGADESRENSEGYAMTRYRKGRALAAAGKYDQAEKELRAAVELTDLPGQAQSFINQIIREQAGKKPVYLADVQAAFKAQNQGKPPGDEWFLDNVHPNPAGHRLIAQTILQTMIDERLARPAAGAPAVQAAADAYAQSLGAVYLYENYLYAATEQEYMGRIRKSVRMCQKALELVPDGRVASETIQRLNSSYQGIDTSE